MNKQLLCSKMKLFGDTQATLAKALGISLSQTNAKINEKSAEFTQNEICAIKKRYRLIAEEVDDTFFDIKVS